ncbi:peptide ABC transporter substrate-binding protein [Alkaliphilus serpentinus]|uniref:Peptide ABC transporter substrate-binding protein n=1 Tax=Alkaliphilus serpentinus TaxID=1482731 RepID=A0A833HM96_9FIRM|nr:peptide ABC transporter substrate-binding protein [Alkaliphilus serpentinus]KAB3527261.1 peptide ABC transporter substrate-binding protein [Alkaliphilus serpentinus]
MKKKVLVLFLILILAITGCSTQEPVEEPNDEEEIVENYLPAEGGTLNLTITRFNNLNPLFNNNRSLNQLHKLIYQGLLKFNDKVDLEGVLAEKWEVSQDGQSIDFTLRKDVKWHDGEAFTAEDVIFTFDAIKGNIDKISNPSVYNISIKHISDIKILQENVLRVTFTRPFSNGLEVMTFPILPKHLFEEKDLKLMLSEDFPLIGTGPYKLKDYQKMRAITLMKNQEYWGAKPYINEIQVSIVPDRAAQLSIFENEEIHVAEPTTLDWGKYVDHKDIRVFEYASNKYEFIGFNFRNPVLQDINIRRAIAYGIDRHKLISNVYMGHGTAVDVPIFPESWLYDENSIKYGYDTAKAKEALEASGYHLREGSVRSNEDGEALKLKLITNKDNPLRERTAHFIKEELTALGIEVEVQLLDWEEFNNALNTDEYDMILGGWELSMGQDLAFAFHSSHIGDTNFIAYESEEMDLLLEDAFKATTREEKVAKYSEVQQLIINDLPYFSLFFQNRALLVKKSVYGDFDPRMDDIYNDIEDWYINRVEDPAGN